MYHRYLKTKPKPKTTAIEPKRLDTGDLMAMLLLMLLLADGNEESHSVVTTLLIFLFL